MRFRIEREILAVRGERLALTRLENGTADISPGAPQDELLQLFGLDEVRAVALQISFDIDDMDAALAELDAAHARFEELHPQTRRLENAASRAVERYFAHFAARDLGRHRPALFADDICHGRSPSGSANAGSPTRSRCRDRKRAGDRRHSASSTYMTSAIVAARGERLILVRVSSREQAARGVPHGCAGRRRDRRRRNQIAAIVVFDLDDFDAAFAELDARYLAGRSGRPRAARGR